MGCRARYADYGLEVDTWCGLNKDSKGEPQEICELVDKTDAYHFVYVANLKTYSRQVHVRGFIDSENNRAKFDGPTPPVVSETEWEEDRTILGQFGNDNWTFNHAALKKKSGAQSGEEEVLTSLEYEDQWTIGKDSLKSTPISFRVETQV
jgi:hypothetical protein